MKLRLSNERRQLIYSRFSVNTTFEVSTGLKIKARCLASIIMSLTETHKDTFSKHLDQLNQRRTTHVNAVFRDCAITTMRGGDGRILPPSRLEKKGVGHNFYVTRVN